MSLQDISCPICSEVFTNSDEIFSTNCGHIFHFQCLHQWLEESNLCPQCRDQDPDTHRIYLNFIESDSSSTTGTGSNDSSSNNQPQQSNSESAQIHELILQQLQEELNLTHASFSELQVINESLQNELNFKTGRLNEYKMKCKALKELNLEMKQDFEEKSQINLSEIVNKYKIVSSKLKEKSEKCQTLEEFTQILEQRLNQAETEIKQIRDLMKSTQCECNLRSRQMENSELIEKLCNENETITRNLQRLRQQQQQQPAQQQTYLNDSDFEVNELFKFITLSDNLNIS